MGDVSRRTGVRREKVLGRRLRYQAGHPAGADDGTRWGLSNSAPCLWLARTRCSWDVWCRAPGRLEATVQRSTPGSSGWSRRLQKPGGFCRETRRPQTLAKGLLGVWTLTGEIKNYPGKPPVRRGMGASSPQGPRHAAVRTGSGTRTGGRVASRHGPPFIIRRGQPCSFDRN
jgi:hypothetical protein